MTTTYDVQLGDVFVRGNAVQLATPHGLWTTTTAEALRISRRLEAAAHLIATRPHCHDCENHQ